jgi:4-amino-4-deoxy-L-arabinose transferase-like glycosyltransferase
MSDPSENAVKSAQEMKPAAWRVGHLIILAVVCVASLAPFANKAYHIDDTLFLKLAQQIQEHPLDFFGFQVNWHFTPQPMAEVTKNPPLWGYALAAAASVLGFGETGLHFFAMIPAVFAVWGTYRLAQRCTANPMFAALVTLFMPAFLVSSTTVMCDTAMLALWMWALVLWLEGLDESSGANPDRPLHADKILWHQLGAVAPGLHPGGAKAH